MNQRLFPHLVSAGLGVAAAPSVAFFFLDGVIRTAFLAVWRGDPSAAGSAAGSCRRGAHAQRVAGGGRARRRGRGGGSSCWRRVGFAGSSAGRRSALLAIHFWAHSDLATLAAVMRYTPAGLVLPFQE